MNAPFLDIRASYLELKTEIDLAVSRVLDSGWYISGEEVTKFENDYAEYCEANYCVGVANGLDALRLALLALGVKPGDEVIVPSNTYIATLLAVSQCGAVPVPVEPAMATFNMDPQRIEAAITSRTKVIIPVHLYGQPADLDPILAIAERHALAVLEDAAQAHGARYKGKRLGSHGHAVAWSFYPGKNLGAFGDGGAVTTDDSGLARRIRLLSNYGSETKYANEVRGYNSRLDPLQAAALAVKLKHLNRWNEVRRSIGNRYVKEISATAFGLPVVPDYAEVVWHVFPVMVDDRASVQSGLKAAGIDTLIHYPIPPHLQEAYMDLGYSKGSFPISEDIHNRVLSLPMYPQMTLNQVDAVIEACNALNFELA